MNSVSDQDENGRPKPTWGMPEQGNPHAAPAQPMAPPPQAYSGQPTYGGPPPGHYPAQKSNKGLVIGLISTIVILVLVGVGIFLFWMAGGFGRPSRLQPAGAGTPSPVATGPQTSPGSGGDAPGSGDNGSDAGDSNSFAYWLGGTWKKSCSDADYFLFLPGARRFAATDHGEEMRGTYTLNDSGASLTMNGQTMQMGIDREGPNAMRATLAGDSINLIRCSGSGTDATPVAG